MSQSIPSTWTIHVTERQIRHPNGSFILTALRGVTDTAEESLENYQGREIQSKEQPNSHLGYPEIQNDKDHCEQLNSHLYYPTIHTVIS